MYSFSDNHLQTITSLTNFTLNLSNHFEKNHETMAKREKMCILVSTEIKIPKGSKRIPSVDIVYYMSLKGVLNLSRKLTLR